MAGEYLDVGGLIAGIWHLARTVDYLAVGGLVAGILHLALVDGSVKDDGLVRRILDWPRGNICLCGLSSLLAPLLLHIEEEAQGEDKCNAANNHHYLSDVRFFDGSHSGRRVGVHAKRDRVCLVVKGGDEVP